MTEVKTWLATARDSKGRSFPKFCFIILTNEIEPRKEKFRKRLPPELSAIIIRLEFDGKIDRRTTRKIFDEWYQGSYATIGTIIEIIKEYAQ